MALARLANRDTMNLRSTTRTTTRCVCVCDGVATVVPLPHRRWPRPVHP
jgi:hypothetical protein